MAQVELEKFYTKGNVAQRCIDFVPDISSYDTIIEPSAGAGAFSNLLPQVIAYDIAPEGEGIIKQDFLKLESVPGLNILFVGNPPFGSRSVLAKQFIKKCRELGGETIAFVLPDTFSKLTNQGHSLFPANWNLVVEEKLGSDNFLIGDQTYHVPCSFYVWTKRPSEINLRKTKLAQSDEFTFLAREDESADFVINGNSGKVRELKHVTNPKAEHYLYVNDRTRVEEIREVLFGLDFRFESSCNGGVAWISQQEILEAYYSQKWDLSNIVNVTEDSTINRIDSVAARVSA